MQAYDGPIYIADAALFLKATQPQLGINDPYQLNEKQYAAVLELLRNQHALIHRYWHDTTVQMSDFKNEGVVASSAWPYQANALKAEGQPIATVFPKEGVTGWADTTMLHAEAKHPSCAYKWMNWSLEPKVQGDVAAWFGSVPAAPEGCKASTLLGDEGLRNQRLQPVRQNRVLENPAGGGRQVRPVQPLDAGLHRHHGRPLIRLPSPSGRGGGEGPAVCRGFPHPGPLPEGEGVPAPPNSHRFTRISDSRAGLPYAGILPLGACTMTTPAVQFTHVSRLFGDVRAVDRVSIDIQ